MTPMTPAHWALAFAERDCLALPSFSVVVGAWDPPQLAISDLNPALTLEQKVHSPFCDSAHDREIARAEEVDHHVVN